MRYVCTICGHVYDETGNVPWSELPASWKCPLCGAAKSDFIPEGATSPSPVKEAAKAAAVRSEVKPLNAVETAALCSNLAKGCEKQYLPEQAAAFRRLADWFGTQAETKTDASFEALLQRVEDDLAEGFPVVKAVASQEGDRGAMRSLTWAEKVSRILKNLLTEYSQKGAAMLTDTGVYVCTICGFVSVGSEPPEICPVCKAPGRKIVKVD